MTRILHVLSQRPGRSGSGVFLWAMVREAARRGYQQHAVVAGPPDTSYREVPPLGPSNVSVAAFPCDDAPFPVPGNSDVMPYPSTIFSQMNETQLEQYLGVAGRVLEQARDRFRPDIVHAHHLWLMTALTRRVMDGIPMVATSHNAELRQLIKAPHLGPLAFEGIRAIDRICVLTPRSAQDTVEAYGVDPDRLRVTGAGFRDDLFHPPATAIDTGKAVARLQREHGLELPTTSTGTPRRYVTFIARLSSPKGVPQLLRAVEQLQGDEELPPWTLLLVGASGSGDDGRRMDELVAAARAKDPERVVHLGAMPQAAVADVLRLSDLFVLPSLFEGLPLVMLEAAACGCPCLVSALPPLASWIPQSWHDSGCFLLLPALETVDADCPVASDQARYVDDLARGIRHFLTQPPSFEQRLTLAEALRAHTWSCVFERYEEVYRGLGVPAPS